MYFANRLTDYKTSKGAIRFQYNNPIPLELIIEIAKWCRAKHDKRFLEALEVLESKLIDGKIVVERVVPKLAKLSFCKKNELSDLAIKRYQEILVNIERGNMKATVLVDNIGNEVAKGEWGLSIFIENQNEKILLDMGATGLFAQNAMKMGIELNDVDYGVLSHAHYDHADGMKYFFDCNKNAKVYLQNSCKDRCFYKKWFFRKYIGIEKSILNNYADRIAFVSGDFEINKGVYLISHKTKDLDKIGKLENMYIKTKEKFIPDSFDHEQSLVFDTPSGLVIFNSCSHGGADNIINEVIATLPGKKIKAIIGGFHLYNKSENKVREIARKIKATGVEQIYTGHCTGKGSYNVMKDELGDMVHQLKVGLVMEF